MSALTDNVFRQAKLALELPICWRPIHYLGSKLRLAESIRDHLSELDPSGGPVCDLFAGSGTVSLALSCDRNVVAADIQEYSRVLCTALLQPPVSLGGSTEAVCALTRPEEILVVVEVKICLIPPIPGLRNLGNENRRSTGHELWSCRLRRRSTRRNEYRKVALLRHDSVACGLPSDFRVVER